MEFLYSNYLPIKTKQNTFQDEFIKLISIARTLDIGVGYITTESLMELKRILQLNAKLEQLNLIIGMHYIERFTKPQYDAALDLNSYLKEKDRGSIRLVCPFRFHGKMYSYSDEVGPFAGIIGSNNLGSIVDNNDRTYEASVLIKNRAEAEKIQCFLQELSQKASKNIDELEITEFRANTSLLENQDKVERVEKLIDMQRTNISFSIPLKGEEASQSNLNAYFGKGRENKRTKFIKPRHWYEVEIIVPTNIRRLEGYPKNDGDNNGIFTAITDDGWKFECQVEGGNKTDKNKNKNLRSKTDLKILGKWLKGRLEEAGALKVGEMVTKEVLEKYGRNNFTMTQLDKQNYWYLDFGVG